MIYTRDAHTNDEAWMLEKLSQQTHEHDSFRPEDFLVAVDEETEERVAFGRLEYHRNVDDTEYVELNSVIILDRAEDEQGCLLLVDLAEQALESGQQQVFTFPNKHHDVFKEVGFNQIPKDEMPQVMQNRLDKMTETFGDETVSMAAQPKNIEFELDEDDEEFQKPEGTSEEEVETLKDELGIDDNATTKYSI